MNNLILKTIFFEFLLILSLKGFTQTKSIADADVLNRIVKLRKLPDIDVWDKNGSKTSLHNYININQRNPGKPIMLIAFGFRGNYSIDEIVDVANSSIPDEYNVVVICLASITEVTEKRLTNEGYERLMGKMMVVKTVWEKITEKFYKTSWPFSVFADKDKNVLYFDDGWVKPVRTVQSILRLIQAGSFVPMKYYWNTATNEMTTNDDPATDFHTEYKVDGNKINCRQGRKGIVLFEQNYLLKDGIYYYEGVSFSKNKSGQFLYKGEFREGVPVTTVKGWYEDGNLKFEIPVNGKYKQFLADGKIAGEGEMKNGLGNGLFISYTSDSTKETVTFKEGELYGPAIKYMNGKIICEKLYLPDYIPDEDACFSEGLLAVRSKEGKYGYINKDGKLITQAYFDSADPFKNGKAYVSRYGKVFQIDKAGKLVE